MVVDHILDILDEEKKGNSVDDVVYQEGWDGSFDVFSAFSFSRRAASVYTVIKSGIKRKIMMKMKPQNEKVTLNFFRLQRNPFWECTSSQKLTKQVLYATWDMAHSLPTFLELE